MLDFNSYTVHLQLTLLMCNLIYMFYVCKSELEVAI